MICVDEAYMDFSEGSVLSLVAEYSNLIVLKTLSKSVGLAGIRVGFAVSSVHNISLIKTAKSPYNLNILSQKIAEIVLKKKEYLFEQKKKLVNNRVFLERELKKIKNNSFYVCPSCTNFVYVKTPDAQAIYRSLLKKGIVVRCFGEYLRISAGRNEENQFLLAGLEEFYEKR